MWTSWKYILPIPPTPIYSYFRPIQGCSLLSTFCIRKWFATVWLHQMQTLLNKKTHQMSNIHGFLKDANITRVWRLVIESSTSPLPPEWIYVSNSPPVEKSLNQRKNREGAELHKNTSPNCHHCVLMWRLPAQGPSLVSFKKTQNQPDGYNYILATQVSISSKGKKKCQSTRASSQTTPHLVVPGVCLVPNPG